MKTVSIIVPCFNEQATIQQMLQAVYEQQFPREEIEVVIADGRSTDSSLIKIKDYQETHPELKIIIVDNEKRVIPSGLNAALNAASGEYVIRLDGHSIPEPEYVSKCVRCLQDGKGDNVGGAWEIKPRGKSWQARSVAMAASHPLGVGDAHYRIGGKAQSVDTVPFGAYRRETIVRLGMYNESLLTNEDYELNTRIRKIGGIIWFDPDIRSVYLAAPNFNALVKQYFRYGFWKARMLRLHPKALRWRQALPPLFVLGLIFLLGLGFLWRPFWIMLMSIGLCYSMILLATGVLVAFQKKDASLMLGVPIAIMTMHFAWGTAFLWSWITPKNN
jgi:succinoglycan biosynthesis protein ExoA